ncbi:ATP-binding protein [Phytohabitans flavus]|uniref:ATP-binding protein n=1 Tax=Phytohabitans flavus TaxID=1076124 RepID=UPI0015652AFB
MNPIDRQDALELLDELVRGTSSGRGGVVLVTGATATGKSTLLDACRRRGQELGAVALAATASPAEQNLPLGCSPSCSTPPRSRSTSAPRLPRRGWSPPVRWQAPGPVRCRRRR